MHGLTGLRTESMIGMINRGGENHEQRTGQGVIPGL